MSRSNNTQNTPQSELMKLLPSLAVHVNKAKGFPLKAFHLHLADSGVVELLENHGPEELREHLQAFTGGFRSTSATKKLIQVMTRDDPTGILGRKDLYQPSNPVDFSEDNHGKEILARFESTLLFLLVEHVYPEQVKGKKDLENFDPNAFELLKLTDTKQFSPEHLRGAVKEQFGVDLPQMAPPGAWAKAIKFAADNFFANKEEVQLEMTKQHVELVEEHFRGKNRPTFTVAHAYLMDECPDIDIIGAEISEEESDDDDDKSGDDDDRKGGRGGKKGRKPTASGKKAMEPPAKKSKKLGSLFDKPLGTPGFSTRAGDPSYPGASSSSCPSLTELAKEPMGKGSKKVTVAMINASPEAAQAWVDAQILMVTPGGAAEQGSLCSFSVDDDGTVAFQVTKMDGEPAAVDLSVEVAAECMQAAVINGTQVSQRELDVLN